ncbi:hypothetical protein Tco_1063778 [Tanacetum coccineum]
MFKFSPLGIVLVGASPGAYEIDVVIAGDTPGASAVGGAGGDASGASVDALVGDAVGDTVRDGPRIFKNVLHKRIVRLIKFTSMGFVEGGRWWGEVIKEVKR